MIEQRRRTLARVLTWRLGGVALGVLLGWFFTGSWMIGAEFGLAYNAIRAVSHYFHERFWLLYIKWGRDDLEPPACSRCRRVHNANDLFTSIDVARHDSGPTLCRHDDGTVTIYSKEEGWGDLRRRRRRSAAR